jgi:catalase
MFSIQSSELIMPTDAKFTNATGAPLADNFNIQTAGPRGPATARHLVD